MYKKLILITESLVVTCTLFLVTSLMAPSSLAASPQPQTPLLSIASIEDFELADPVNPPHDEIAWKRSRHHRS